MNKSDKNEFILESSKIIYLSCKKTCPFIDCYNCRYFIKYEHMKKLHTRNLPYTFVKIFKTFGVSI